MTERYEEIPGFTDYAISDTGVVINMYSHTELKPRPNQYGLYRVGMSRDGQQHTRAVAHLVADAFIRREREDFDTVIHLDGNRENCRAENLMWRPRWFAIAFHKQFFRETFHIEPNPIQDVFSGSLYNSPKHAATTLGILYNDIILSFTNDHYTFPTMQKWTTVNQ